MRNKSILSPLCYLPSGKLVCYKDGEVIIMKDGTIIKKIVISVSKKERYLGWSRYMFRLLRMGIRAAEAIDESHIVYSVGNMLYELNLKTGELSDGYFCGEGIRPLIFTSVKNIEGFDDGLYFGGYLGNPDKRPVDIYKRVGVDKWESVYAFPHGAINHVHAIVADPYRQCLWIFTGDFDEAAAIWKVTDNFKKVERVACNDQKYRACVVFPVEECLLYATDAPFADDFIYLMNTDLYDVKTIAPIDGSCIYGCMWKDKYVFSSTVEPDGRDSNIWRTLFGRKRGAGIKNDYVHMYCGNLKDGFKEIYKEKKDWLPYASFQFGVFKFPYGDNNTDTFYFQPIATNKNDLCLMTIKEHELK